MKKTLPIQIWEIVYPLGIYFVVESKWGKADANLQEVERNKIKCGKLHFEYCNVSGTDAVWSVK